jgi:dipeptidyl aminopeptidase/acylaminoacyl peptidase
MSMKYLVGVLFLVLNIRSSLSKPKLTLDEFFTHIEFPSLILAPDDGQSILTQTRHHIWDQNINEHHLYLHSINGTNKKLVTRHASSSLKPRWQGEWIAYVVENQLDNSDDEQHYIHLYSTRTEQTFPLALGKESIHAFTWSNTNTSLYFATRTSWTNETEEAYNNEWKDVIEHTEKDRGDTIYRLNIEDITRFQIELLTNISLRVVELTCSLDGKYLVFSTESRSQEIDSMEDFELYSYDLSNHSSFTAVRLTNNQATERNLKWLNDESIFFTVTSEGSIEGEYRDSQGRLYSLNITSFHIQRWADQFTGSVTDFALLEHGRQGVVILGQLSTEIQVYTQQPLNDPLIKRTGWNGTYEKIVTMSSGNRSTIAFTHSSFDSPQEIYSIDTIDQLSAAQPVTNENKLFTERNLPKGTSYRWLNKDDGIEIEGVLLYPPDKFQEKNLPLLVLIHGGPYGADMNAFHADWYSSAIMMATEDWLVLQPNYRGSTGIQDLIR